MSGERLAVDTAAWTSPWRPRRVLDKAVLAGGLLGCAVALPAWPGGLLAGAVAVAVLLGPARVRPGLLLRTVRIPLAFIALGAVSLLVAVSWDAGPRVSPVPQALPEAATVLVRGTSGALAVLVLAATTPMVDLFAALHRARVPAALVEVASLVYRLVFVLVGSVHAIREAQEARLGFTSRSAAYRSLSALIAAVLVRSWTRARRLEDGLAGRGYVDALPTLEPPRSSSPTFVAASLALVAGIVAVSWVPDVMAVPR